MVQSQDYPDNSKILTVGRLKKLISKNSNENLRLKAYHWLPVSNNTIKRKEDIIKIIEQETQELRKT